MPYQGQTGWFSEDGTSVGAPNWAGIVAAAATEGSTALRGNSATYSGGYAADLRDITTGTNGSCGAAAVSAAPIPALRASRKQNIRGSRNTGARS